MSLRRANPDPSLLADAVGRLPEPLSGVTLGELGLVEVTGRAGRLRVTISALDDDPEACTDLAARARARIRSGGGEVSVVPADEAARRRASGVLRPRRRSPGALGSPTSVVAVASGKGGVGKSTVTANLAAALAAQGQRVGLLDADVWGYSQTLLLGARRAPVAVPGLMFPVTAHGVRVMSTGFFVSDDEPVVWRGPMLHKALEQFLEDVWWGDLDVLLVDLPPGTGDVTLSVLELLPDAAVLVLTTPQLAAESVAARVGRMVRDARLPVAGVVENMTGEVFGSGGGSRLAVRLDAPLLATVPLTAAVRESGDEGTPLVLSDPRHPVAQTFRRLAADLPRPRRSLVGRALPLSVAAG